MYGDARRGTREALREALVGGSYRGDHTSREREAKVLKSALEDEKLHREVRNFFEEVLQGSPDQDIRILAAAQSREESEEEHKELTRAMQELL